MKWFTSSANDHKNIWSHQIIIAENDLYMNKTKSTVMMRLVRASKSHKNFYASNLMKPNRNNHL